MTLTSSSVDSLAFSVCVLFGSLFVWPTKHEVCLSQKRDATRANKLLLNDHEMCHEVNHCEELWINTRRRVFLRVCKLPRLAQQSLHENQKRKIFKFAPCLGDRNPHVSQVLSLFFCVSRNHGLIVSLCVSVMVLLLCWDPPPPPLPLLVLLISFVLADVPLGQTQSIIFYGSALSSCSKNGETEQTEPTSEAALR